MKPTLERLPLSAVVLTLNEEKNLEACLASIANWIDELFVIDSGSRDGTLDIAKRYGAQIFENPFENYAQQRNWAQANLPFQREWVLHIDADERVTPELADAIRDLFESGGAQQYNGAAMARRTVFWGRAIFHGGHYPVYQLRLVRHAFAHCEDRLYDQHFVVQGPTTLLRGDLIDIIGSDLTTWTIRHAWWGNLEAQELLRASAAGTHVAPDWRGTPIERRRWMRTSLYERAPMFWRALVYFLYRYFIRLGFLDGREGLVFHILQAFWFRFYIDARLYELQHLSPPASSDTP